MLIIPSVLDWPRALLTSSGSGLVHFVRKISSLTQSFVNKMHSCLQLEEVSKRSIVRPPRLGYQDLAIQYANRVAMSAASRCIFARGTQGNHSC